MIQLKWSNIYNTHVRFKIFLFLFFLFTILVLDFIIYLSKLYRSTSCHRITDWHHRIQDSTSTITSILVLIRNNGVVCGNSTLNSRKTPRSSSFGSKTNHTGITFGAHYISNLTVEYNSYEFLVVATNSTDYKWEDPEINLRTKTISSLLSYPTLFERGAK